MLLDPGLTLKWHMCSRVFGRRPGERRDHPRHESMDTGYAQKPVIAEMTCHKRALQVTDKHAGRPQSFTSGRGRQQRHAGQEVAPHRSQDGERLSRHVQCRVRGQSRQRNMVGLLISDWWTAQEMGVRGTQTLYDADSEYDSECDEDYYDNELGKHKNPEEQHELHEDRDIHDGPSRSTGRPSSTPSQ